MKRIVHIITGLNTGGAEMMLYKLLSGMDRSKFQLSVVSLTDKGTLGERIEALGIPVKALNMSSGVPSPRYIASLAKIIIKDNPGVIQGWMYHANLLATISSSLFFKKCPVIWNIRQSLYSLDYEKKGTAIVIKAGAYFSTLPKYIIYNSITGADQHENLGYTSSKRHIIPNGFATEIFTASATAHKNLRAELCIPADALIIGLVGRYHPMKDHATFLRAASILIKKHISAHFVLAGKQVDCNNSELKQLITDLGIYSQVHLLGERSDTPLITAAFDIATCSSFTEGFPNVVGEAMSCGVPCVVTDVGDSAWVVGDTGKIVATRDPEALSAAWTELIEMGPEGRKELGSKARQRIIDNFSLAAVVKQYEHLYEQVLSKRGKYISCAA